MLFPPDACAPVTCAFLQYENNKVCPEKDLKRASCEMLKIPSVSSPSSLCGLASLSLSRAVTKALRGHLCHQTRRVTEPPPWPRGWHTWQREMTAPLTYVCERLEAAFFVYSDEGVNRGRRKCPLLWGKSDHRALQSHTAHSRTTCYTHTHTFEGKDVSSGYNDSNQCWAGSAKVCELSLRAEMTFAVNHEVFTLWFEFGWERVCVCV